MAASKARRVAERDLPGPRGPAPRTPPGDRPPPTEMPLGSILLRRGRTCDRELSFFMQCSVIPRVSGAGRSGRASRDGAGSLARHRSRARGPPLEPGQDEGVDRVADPPHSFDSGNRRTLRRYERPVRLPFAPSAIQRRIVSVWAGERTLPDFGGGIRSSGSSAVIRR